MPHASRHARQSGKISGGCVLSIVIVIVLVIGGGYFAFQKGMGVVAEQAKVAIRDNPAVREHLGEIQEMSLSLGATAAAPENKEKKDGEKAVLVFDVTGSKANGQVSLWVSGAEGNQGYTKGRIRLADGTKHDIVFEQQPDVEAPAEDGGGGKDGPDKDGPEKDGPDKDGRDG